MEADLTVEKIKKKMIDLYLRNSLPNFLRKLIGILIFNDLNVMQKLSFPKT